MVEGCWSIFLDVFIFTDTPDMSQLVRDVSAAIQQGTETLSTHLSRLTRM